MFNEKQLSDRKENTMAFDINIMKNEFDLFFEKYKNCDFEGENDEADYVKDADRLLGEFGDKAESEEEKEALSKKLALMGGKLMMLTDNPNAPKYYHKAIDLQPNSYDIRWDYYTTLEEIVENEEYATKELIDDAIECLRFCIDYCDTEELRAEKCVQNRYYDLARVYMAAKDYANVVVWTEKYLDNEWDEDVQELLDTALEYLEE